MFEAMRASAPGKLILTGEYAVLDGAPAVVIGVDRRVTAAVGAGVSSPFLAAVAEELAGRGLVDAARRAAQISVESAPLYAGTQKLGLGSSAAVTVAATALALELGDADIRAGAIAASTTDGWGATSVLSTVASATREPVDQALVLAVASAAHASAQAARGSRGSGADVAAAVHGGVIEFVEGRVARLSWPDDIALVPFFTGIAAETGPLVAQVMRTRTEEIERALATIALRSVSAVDALAASKGVIAAFAHAAEAFDALAAATGLPLVPACVRAAREAMTAFGGTAKTTGAGGGDVAVAFVPADADLDAVRAAIARAGGQPLDLSIDPDGVRLS